MTLSPSIAIASGLWLAFASPAALADPAGKLGKSDAFIVAPDLPSKPTTIVEPDHPAFLVLVRYPATISAEAANLLSIAARDSLATTDQGYVNEVPEARSPEYFRSRLRDELAKSSFFAIGLFDYLAKRLPANRVGLAPCHIDLHAVDTTRVEMNCAGDIPTVLTVEYSIDRGAIDVLSPSYYALYGTFGPYVTPEWTVMSSWQAAPDTFGTLASTRFAFAPRGAHPAKYPFVRTSGGYFDFATRVATPLSLKVNGPAAFALIERRDFKSPLVVPGKESFFRPRILKLQDKHLALINGGPDNRREFLRAAGDYDLVGRAAMEALATLPAYPALRDSWKVWLSKFDPELAAQWPRYPLPETQISRYRILKEFMAAEREVAASADLQFAQSVLFGSAGDALVAQIAAEYELVDSARRTRTAMNFAAIIGALIVAQDRTPEGFESAIRFVDTVEGKTTGQLEEQQRAFDARYFTPSSASVVRIESLSGAIQEIHVGGTAEIREQLKTLYKTWFTQPLPQAKFDLAKCLTAAGETVTSVTSWAWSGACAGGIAGGNGLASNRENARNVTLMDFRNRERGYFELLLVTWSNTCDGKPTVELADGTQALTGPCKWATGGVFAISRERTGEPSISLRLSEMSGALLPGHVLSSSDRALLMQQYKEFLRERDSLIVSK